MNDVDYKRAMKRFAPKRAEQISQLAAEIGGLLEVGDARVETVICKGKHKGTLDYCLKLAGGSIFISNLNSKLNVSKTTAVISECLELLKQRYERLLENSGEVWSALKEREIKDNKRAVSKGFQPYALKRVGIATTGLYTGWVYVVLEINSKERLHIETKLGANILDGKYDDISNIRKRYVPAGSYQESDVNFIEGGVGFVFDDKRFTVRREGLTLFTEEHISKKGRVHDMEQDNKQVGCIDKLYWIQLRENCNDGLAGHHLDIRIHVPDGLTKEQIENLDCELADAMTAYGEAHDNDYAEMDYHTILETTARKLNINFEYPKEDYTIYL